MFAPLIGGIAAFVGGIFADRIGRKRILLYTFFAIGVAYAINGFIAIEGVVYFLSFTVLSVSTGIMWVLFILVLWGDLAKFVTSEKYYVLGISPFFLTNILQQFSAVYFTENTITNVFSLAAFFSFLSTYSSVDCSGDFARKKRWNSNDCEILLMKQRELEKNSKIKILIRIFQLLRLAALYSSHVENLVFLPRT